MNPRRSAAWIEGHRDTERGQEFDLHTEYVVAGEAAVGRDLHFPRAQAPAAGRQQEPVSRSVEGAPDAVAIKSQQLSRAVRVSVAATDSSPAT